MIQQHLPTRSTLKHSLRTIFWSLDYWKKKLRCCWSRRDAKQSKWSQFRVFVFQIWRFFCVRIEFEEELLVEQFGEEYRIYMAQVPRCLPWKLAACMVKIHLCPEIFLRLLKWFIDVLQKIACEQTHWWDFHMYFVIHICMPILIRN